MAIPPAAPPPECPNGHGQMVRDVGRANIGDFYGFAMEAAYITDDGLGTNSREIHVVDVYYCKVCRIVQLFTRETDSG